MAIAEARAGPVERCSMRWVCAREINSRSTREVMGVVVEPDFRLWWIWSGYVIEGQPLQRGSLAAGVRWDRGRCDR